VNLLVFGLYILVLGVRILIQQKAWIRMRTPNRFSHICEFFKNLKNEKKDKNLHFLKISLEGSWLLIKIERPSTRFKEKNVTFFLPTI
jgi:hypothetical protein